MRRLPVTLVAVFTLGLFLVLPASPSFASGNHAAITISSNAGFTSCACVTSGNGTAASPFVIGPWTIGTPSNGSEGGWSVKVDNSRGRVTDFFNIFGIQSSYTDLTPTDPNIWLVGVTNPTTISGDTQNPQGSNGGGTGIRLDNSSHITISNVTYAQMNGEGAVINGSSFVTIDNSRLKAVPAASIVVTPPIGDGILAINSSNLAFGTSPACPTNGAPCVDESYSEGIATYLQNTHDVVINNESAGAADTGSFVLDGTNTFNVTIKNSTGTGDGPICHNEVTSGQTANDLQGGLHLINGAHDNTFMNDTFTADTGFDVASGGNGFYVQGCTGSQPFTPVEAPMGAGNTFTNVCYRTTNITPPPAKAC